MCIDEAYKLYVQASFDCIKCTERILMSHCRLPIAGERLQSQGLVLRDKRTDRQVEIDRCTWSLRVQGTVDVSHLSVLSFCFEFKLSGKALLQLLEPFIPPSEQPSPILFKIKALKLFSSWHHWAWAMESCSPIYSALKVCTWLLMDVSFQNLVKQVKQVLYHVHFE